MATKAEMPMLYLYRRDKSTFQEERNYHYHNEYRLIAVKYIILLIWFTILLSYVLMVDWWHVVCGENKVLAVEVGLSSKILCIIELMERISVTTQPEFLQHW